MIKLLICDIIGDDTDLAMGRQCYLTPLNLRLFVSLTKCGEVIDNDLTMKQEVLLFY